MDRTHDIVIVGAGPAGCAVAARLAQHGLADRVVILDRYSFPRDKPCGGALTGHMGPAMEALGLALRVDSAVCDTSMVRFGRFDRTIRMGNPVAVIRRQEFDADLVAQIKMLGVTVVENEGVKRYRHTDNGVLIETTLGRTLQAKVLVGADGAASVVRKQILQGKAKGKRKKAIPHRLFMCEMDVPRPADLQATMSYDFSLMNRGLSGYLWVFPAPNNRVNVGLMHYPSKNNPRSGSELTELLRTGLQDYGIALPESGVRGWPVWGYNPGAAVSECRVLTVGDAAGIDGLTGEGIAVALEQAVVAGDAIHRAFSDNQFSFTRYKRQLRKATIGRELSLDRKLAQMLYGSRGKRWRDWLSLILFDDKVLEMYASRVDGTEILSKQQPRLYVAFLRHIFVRRRRLRRLQAASEIRC